MADPGLPAPSQAPALDAFPFSPTIIIPASNLVFNSSRNWSQISRPGRGSSRWTVEQAREGCSSPQPPVGPLPFTDPQVSFPELWGHPTPSRDHVFLAG